MPKFVSKEGAWYPAKERIALKNLSGKVKVVDEKEIQPGDDYIYEGGDRAALFELFKANVDHLGENFRRNPEFLQAMRNQGFNTVDDYLKAFGYDEKKVEEEFAAKASKVHKDELPKRVEAIKVLGGGKDTTGGGQDRYGGFGPQPKD